MEAKLDFFVVHFLNQQKQYLLGADEQSRYAPFETLFNFDGSNREDNMFNTFYRKPEKGIAIKATRKAISLSYTGAYFRTKDCYKRLKAHLKYFSRHYEGLIRINRIDLALVVPSETGDPEEVLYFNKNNKVQKRKNTGFQASKFYSLDNEDIRTSGIYYGNSKTRRLVLYNIAQEIEAQGNENKESFYRNTLKEAYETSIKAEIRCVNRASLNNKHLFNLLDGNFNEVYQDITQGFFRDFELQTKDGNPTRAFKSLKSKFINARIRD